MPDEITTASTASIKTIKNLKTDQIIYPVTKANAVYLNSTVEGEGETPVLQTVQGKLNDTRDDLDFWIKNKSTEYSQEYNSDGYYIRIGVDKVGNGYLPPFAYIDIRDLGTATEEDPRGNLVSNLILASNVDASKRHNNALITNRDIRCTFQGGASNNYASLRQMVGRAVDTGLPALSSIEQLDNLKNNVIYYAPGNGVSLGLPFAYAMIWQYCASGTYKIQFAAQYNSGGWIISRSKGLADGATFWNDWKTILQNGMRGSITGTSNLSNGTSGFSWSQTNGVCILTMMPILKAMTYTSSTPLFTVPSAPYPNNAGYIRFMAMAGNTPRDLKLNRETGVVTFNNSLTLTSTSYLIGQLVYPYAVSI